MMRSTVLSKACIGWMVLLALVAPGWTDTPKPQAGAGSGVNLDQVAGKSGEVSGNGAFTHQVSIKLPRGRNNIQPKLSLVYNSQIGNGLLGMGWYLKGLPAIVRMDWDQGIKYDGKDSFGVIGGLGAQPGSENRLVAVGSQRFFEASDSNSEYQAVGQSESGPTYWIMRDGQGNTYYFGGDSAANAGPTGSFNNNYHGIVPASDPTKGIYAWLLVKMEDFYGNAYTVEYGRNLAWPFPTRFPEAISYTVHGSDPGCNGSQNTMCRRVVFDYGDRRHDVTAPPGNHDQTLSEIYISSMGQTVRSYELGYELSPSSGRNRLAWVQEKGQLGGTDLPRQSFHYTDAGGLSESLAVWSGEAFSPLGETEMLLGDVNGDGHDDLVYFFVPHHLSPFATLGLEYALGSDQGFETTVHQIDFGAPNSQINQSIYTHYDRTSRFSRRPDVLLIDVSGDGRDDLVIVDIGSEYTDGSGFGFPCYKDVRPYLRVSVLLSSSAGMGDPTSAASVINRSHYWPESTESDEYLCSLQTHWQVTYGDIDGDMDKDLVFADPTLQRLGHMLGGQGNYSIQMIYDRHDPQVMSSWRPQDERVKLNTSTYTDWVDPRPLGVFVTDIDGDSRDDVVLGYARDLPCKFGTYDSSNKDGILRLDIAMGQPGGLAPVHSLERAEKAYRMGDSGYRAINGFATKMRAGDIDGDGRADFTFGHHGNNEMACSMYASELYTWFPDSGTIYPQISDNQPQPTSASGGKTKPDLLSGDINGDGRSDFIFFYKGVSGLRIATYLASNQTAGALDGPYLHPVDDLTRRFADSDGGPGEAWQAQMADLNGDNLADLVIYCLTKDGWWVQYALGSAGPIDYDGDGVTDVNCGLGALQTHYAGMVPQAEIPLENANRLKLADINGDGKSDLVFAANGNRPVYVMSTPGRPDLLGLIENGIGGSTSVAYKPASHFARAIDAQATYCGGENGYQTSAICGNPDTSRRELVWQVVHNNGRIGDWQKSKVSGFDYENGRIRPGVLTERRGLGFERVQIKNLKTGGQQRRDYIQQYPLQSHVAKESQWGCVNDPNCTVGQKISETYRVYQSEETHGPGVIWTGIVQQWTEKFEGNRPFHRMETFTEFGPKPFKRIIATEIHGAGEVLRTDHQYYPVDPHHWIIGRIHQRYKSRPDILDAAGDPLILDLETFTYADAAQKPLQMIRQERLLSEKPARLHCDDSAPIGEFCEARIIEGVASMITVAHDMQYDVFGSLISVRNAENQRTQTRYDPRWYAYAHDITNAMGHHVFKNYDALGRLTHEADANGHVTETQYDEYGRPERVMKPGDPAGGSSQFEYWHWGDPERQHIVAKNIIKPGQIQKGFTYFDGFGEVYLEGEETGLADPAEVWTFHHWLYDQGQMVMRTSQPYAGNATVFPDVMETRQDYAGRPLLVQRVTGSDYSPVKTLQRTEYFWGGITRTTDSKNQQGTTYRDARGRVLRFQDGLGQETRYEYDIFGNLNQVILPKGVTQNLVDFTYDNWGRRLSMTDSATGRTAYTYDLVGNQLRVIDAKGKTSSYCYDALNRLESVHEGQVTFCAGPSLTRLTYDRPGNLGRLDQAIFTDGQVTFSFDARNRVVEKRIELMGAPENQVVMAMGYDLQDRPIWKIIDRNGPFEQRLDFEKSRNGLLEKVIWNGNDLATFSEYDAFLRIGRKTFRNGVTTAYTYHGDGYLETLSSMNAAGEILQDYFYGFDPVGNMEMIVDQRLQKTVNGVDTDDSQAFTYDALNRLETASGTYGLLEYGYDAMGNITRKDGLDFVYSQSPSSQVIRGVQGSLLAWETSQDELGNRLYLLDNRRGIRYDYLYDALRRLTQVFLDGNPRMEAAYDHDGQRVIKTVYQDDGSATTTFYYGHDYEVRINSHSPGQIARTLHLSDLQGIKLATFTSGDLIHGQPNSGEVTNINQGFEGSTQYGTPPGLWYYHPNHLGSASVVTDLNGSETSRYVFRPYGDVVRPETQSLQVVGSCGYDLVSHQFTGQEFDVESDLHYYGARYYDSLTARFLTADDRILSDGADPQGFNRFAYALNNPLKYTDPSGHEPVEFYYVAIVAPMYVPLIGARATLRGALRGLFFSDYSDRTPGNKEKVMAKLKSPNYWRAILLRTSIGEGALENFPRLKVIGEHFRKMSWSSLAKYFDKWFTPGFRFETTKVYKNANSVMGLSHGKFGSGKVLIRDGTKAMAEFLSQKIKWEKMGLVVDYAHGVGAEVDAIVFHGLEATSTRVLGPVGFGRIMAFGGAAMSAEVSATIEMGGIMAIELYNLSIYEREKINTGVLCNVGACTVAVPWDEWPNNWKGETHQQRGRTFFRSSGSTDFSPWNQYKSQFRKNR